MSKDKWRDDKTKNFIASYIKKQALWNTKCVDYSSKSTKTSCYKELQDEFGLSLTEVKNKIRIFRTTYGQELKKMKTTGIEPKLFWFKLLHMAFNEGKIKSFRKSVPKKECKEESPGKIIIEYNDQEGSENDEKDETHYVFKKSEKAHESDSESQQIIIEPYEMDYEEEDEYHEQPVSISTSAKKSKGLNRSSPSTRVSGIGLGLGSNELFLKSLMATFDKLPDEKNMMARIKIQEILYKIAYEVDK